MKRDHPGMLLRLFREVNLLSNSSRGYSANELAEKLGVSYRTIYRDIGIIEKTGFEIEQNELSKRFKIVHAAELSEHIAFDNEEAAAIEKALMALSDSGTKKRLLEKVKTLSVNAINKEQFTKTSLSNHVKNLSKAIKDKKQAMFYDYRSLNSNVISDRYVEPFAFSSNGDVVKCFELNTKTNKSFKLERIGLVKVLANGWNFEPSHKLDKIDAFGIAIREPKEVKLLLGLKAYSLIIEEYPTVRPFIEKTGQNMYKMRMQVADYKGIARFCLGLMDDITIEDSEEFQSYIGSLLKAQKLI